MSISIKSQKELSNKIKPALRCKKHDLFKEGITIVCEDDIWDYLKTNKWINVKDLQLSEIVDDVLNTPGYIFQSYVLNKISNKEDV